MVKCFDPAGSGIKITLFVVDKKGMVYIGWTAQQLERLGLSLDISHSFTADTAKLFKNCSVHPKKKNSWNKPQTLLDLRLIYDQFSERVAKFVNEIAASEEYNP